MRGQLFVSRMLGRELRREGAKLVSALIPLIVGVAIVVSLTTLKNLILDRLDFEQRELAGSDLSLSIRGKPNDDYLKLKEAIPGERVEEVQFASMLRGGDETTLVQVQGYDGVFPFYGERKVSPPSAGSAYLNGQRLLVEEAIALQLDISVGERVQLGNLEFELSGIIQSSPGETELRMTLAPRVVVSIENLAKAGLLKYGIRQNTITHYKVSGNVESIAKEYRKQAEAIGAELDTPQSRREALSETVDKVYSYLSLFALATLIIGALGAVSGGADYAARKQRSVATLRCIGASMRDLLLVYGLTFFLAALLFSLLGCLLSLPLLAVLRTIFSQFFPVALPSFILPDPFSVIIATLLGAIIPLIFALPAILDLRKVSPLQALREEIEDGGSRRGIGLGALLISVACFLILGAVFSSSPLILVGLGVSLLLLASIQALVARALRYVVGGALIRNLSFPLRHGLAALKRPGSDALFISVLIAIPAFFAFSLWSLQGALTAELDTALAENRDDLVFFDVQKDQGEALEKIASAHGVNPSRYFPLIGMRLSEINGVSTSELRKSAADSRTEWFLTREYLNTYRAELMESEVLLEGELPAAVGTGPVPVSIESRMVKRLGLKLGDLLDFDIQGLTVETVVVGIRKFNFRGVNPGFFVVFPPGVLEEAPQFAVVTAGIADYSKLTAFKKALATELPNVSVIDSRDVKKTIEKIFSKLRAVVVVLGGLFIIAAALLIYVTLRLSSKSRLSEQRIYRTLGAEDRTLRTMAVTEFFSIGLMGALSAVITSVAFLYVVGVYLFRATD